MSITLSDGITTLILPPDLVWVDEDTWSPVVQDVGYSIGGALIIESASKKAGRPITLQSQDDVAWVTRADVLKLRSWASVAGQVLTLAIASRSIYTNVVFDHKNNAIDAKMIVFYGDPDETDRYTVTLRFMEI